MARIIKFPLAEKPAKIGLKKVRKRKRINLEDYGQLNMFAQQVKVISLQAHGSLFEKALKLDEAGDATAEVYYENAVKVGDNKADAYCNLGVIASRRDSVKAIDCFTNCLKEEPRHYEAHYNLANIYSEAGNLDLAKIHYQMAIQIEPEFTSAYYNLGLLLAMKEEFKEAIDMLLRYKLIAEPEDSSNAEKLIYNLRKTVNQ